MSNQRIAGRSPPGSPVVCSNNPHTGCWFQGSRQTLRNNWSQQYHNQLTAADILHNFINYITHKFCAQNQLICHVVLDACILKCSTNTKSRIMATLLSPMQHVVLNAWDDTSLVISNNRHKILTITIRMLTSMMNIRKKNNNAKNNDKTIKDNELSLIEKIKVHICENIFHSKKTKIWTISIINPLAFILSLKKDSPFLKMIS